MAASGTRQPSSRRRPRKGEVGGCSLGTKAALGTVSRNFQFVLAPLRRRRDAGRLNS